MRKSFLTSLLLLTLLAACAPAGPATLRVMTHDSFAVSEPVVRQFEEEHNVKVEFLKSGDGGSALNRAILTKDNPQADLLYGVDNTFLSRALAADIFEPYPSPALDQVFPELILDPEFRALPVDFGDVCINYDKAYFEKNGLTVPQSLADLTKPEYKGLLVVENPATSTPGLAFLLATIAEYGDPGYLDYWRQLRANGVVVVNDWNAAYYQLLRFLGQGSAADGRFLRHQPGRRGDLRQPTAQRSAHRQHHRPQHLLPPGRVCRHSQRHAQPQACRAVR